MSTTVERVLEHNKKYKEEKKQKRLSDKVNVKLEKWKLQRDRVTYEAMTIKKREKDRIASSKEIATQKKAIAKDKVWVKKKNKSKTRWQLVKELDAIFSRYIRLRDADDKGICTCITCGSKVHRKDIQNGHFISRWNYKYRWSVVNCRSQCMPCNIYKSGNYIAYTLYMIWKYGQWVVEMMQEDKELIKISTPEIKEMIEKYKYEVELLMKVKKV